MLRVLSAYGAGPRSESPSSKRSVGGGSSTKASNLFKLFQNDVGLLAAEYGGDIQLKILQHEITVNFGAVYENAAAQELTAHGFPLFYYNSKRFGEVDFLVENDGAVIPIEIKSGKDYYRHNAMDHLLENPEFDIPQGCVFCNGNVELKGKIRYLPIYMLMFLQKKELPEEVIFNTDFRDLNRL